MRSIGLTGGIAAGKSTAAAAFAEAGAVVIDYDLLAREVVEPGTEGLAAVVTEFGPVVDAAGMLDRAALARIVFADDEARRRLEGVLHPRVRRRSDELIAALGPDSVVVHDLPLLVETGDVSRFDLVVVVDAPVEVQLERLVSGRGMSSADARRRIEAQADRGVRLAVADVVLDGAGAPEQLRAEIARLWQRLQDA